MIGETSTSARSFIWFVAVFALMPAVAQLSSYGRLDGAIPIFGLIFGCAYVYLAVRWRTLLAKNPIHIGTVAISNLIFAGIFAGYRIYHGADLTILWGVFVAFGITAYILSSVGFFALKEPPAQHAKKEANQAPLPTSVSVTPAAGAPVAPDTDAAEL
jgi:hypothetical protein